MGISIYEIMPCQQQVKTHLRVSETSENVSDVDELREVVGSRCWHPILAAHVQKWIREQHLIRAKAAICTQSTIKPFQRCNHGIPRNQHDAGNLALSAHPHGRAAAGHKKVCCRQVVPTHRYHWLDVCFMPYRSCPARPTGVGMAPRHPVRLLVAHPVRLLSRRQTSFKDAFPPR